MSERFILPNQALTAQAAAKFLVATINDLAPRQGRISLAISGGKSPRSMFELAANARLPWDQVHLFWVDERAVPPDDPQSNYRMAKESLIDPAGIPGANVHRVLAELPPQEAAMRYTEHIRSFFQLEIGELPQFDLVHRGMGPDAHTASLFPGEPLIGDRGDIAGAVYVEKMKSWRITLLPGVLLAAKATLMYVTGEDKAEAARAVVHEPYDPMKYPTQFTVHDGQNVTWFFDQGAARLL